MLTVTSDDKTDVYFSSLPGQGVIYNVIVWDPLWNTSAAYIPVHTYACSFADLVDNCSSLSKLGLVGAQFKLVLQCAEWWVFFLRERAFNMCRYILLIYFCYFESTS